MGVYILSVLFVALGIIGNLPGGLLANTVMRLPAQIAAFLVLVSAAGFAHASPLVGAAPLTAHHRDAVTDPVDRGADDLSDLIDDFGGGTNNLVESASDTDFDGAADLAAAVPHDIFGNPDPTNAGIGNRPKQARIRHYARALSRILISARRTDPIAPTISCSPLAVTPRPCARTSARLPQPPRGPPSPPLA